jgi:hypothetical protein
MNVPISRTIYVACDPGKNVCAFACHDSGKRGKNKWSMWKIDMPENFGARAGAVRASLEDRLKAGAHGVFVVEGQYGGPNQATTIRLSKVATLVQCQALDAGYTLFNNGRVSKKGLPAEDGEVAASTWQSWMRAGGQTERDDRKAMAMGYARKLVGVDLNDQDMADAVCMVDWMMKNG